MSNGYGDQDPWTPPGWSAANDQPRDAWSQPATGAPASGGASAYQPTTTPPGNPYQAQNPYAPQGPYQVQNPYPNQNPYQGPYPSQAPAQAPDSHPAGPFAPAAGPQGPYGSPSGPYASQPTPYPAQPYPTQPYAPAPGLPYSAGAPYSASGAPWMAYKPGIVALRPMSMGDVLGGAASLIRFNPKSTIGLSLVVQLFVLALSLIGLSFAHGAPRVGATEVDGAGSLARGLTSLLSGASSTVLAGLLAYVVAEAVLGRKPGLGDTWRASRGRILAFIGLQLLLWLGMVLVIGAVVALGFLTWGLTSSTGATVGICLLTGLAAVVALVWLSVRFLVAGPAVIIERLSPVQGLRRSWQLTRGRFWPMLGTQIVANLIAGFASSLLTIPVSLIVAVVAAGNGDTTGTVAASVVAEAIALVLVGPFSAGIQGLLYVDQRIRQEGFDLTLQQCADRGSSPWPVDQAVEQGSASGLGR